MGWDAACVRIVTWAKFKDKETDTRYVSARGHHGPDWTFHGFETVVDRPRIDYIFVSNNVQVERHGVLSDRWNGRYPSDHLPVLAELAL
jgi:endonuclease/exonuclease/phosphatase family metal-dependent hydrolase